MQDLDRLIECLINQHARCKRLVLEDDVSLDELGYDSFSRTELLIAIEDLLETELSLAAICPENFMSVGSVKEMVKKCYMKQSKEV